jgi:hypothetical protein
MAKVGEVERDRVVLGLAEGERHAPSVLITADEDIIGPGEGRAADQSIDAVEIAAPGGSAPIVEGLGEGSLGTNQRRLVGRTPFARLRSLHSAHPHGVPSREGLIVLSNGLTDDEFKKVNDHESLWNKG